MGTLTVRKIAEETVAKIRVRAAQHGRSMEAEVRYWLDAVAQDRVVVDDAPKTLGREEIDRRVSEIQAEVRARFGGVMPTGVVDEYLAEKREAARRGE